MMTEVEVLEEMQDDSPRWAMLKILFSEPVYLYLAFSYAANLLLLSYLGLSKVTSIQAFFSMTTGIYAWTSIALTVVLAGLFGLALTQVGYVAHKLRTLQGMALTMIGGILVLLSQGCPSCVDLFLPTLGVEGGLAAFPLQGIDIKILAGLLIGSSIWVNSKLIVEGLQEEEEESDQDEEPEEVTVRPGFPRWLKPAALVVPALAALYLLPLLPSGMKVDFGTIAASPATPASANELSAEWPQLIEQVLPEGGYRLPISYGDIGPQLVAHGALDYDRFVDLYEQGGRPLSADQLAVLNEGSDEKIVITSENAHFLLNFFWAFGLVNKNPVLDEGLMVEYSDGDVGRFASTGGWSLASKPVTEIYSSAPLVALTEDQQALLERVAGEVYRPCCNNPTSFPDCNHGMAMLGVLEVMASEGASEEEMFEAAKYLNAFWFPQQMLEVATLFKALRGWDFADLDGRLVVGAGVFSGQGFGEAHNYLVENGLLQQSQSQGGGCGVQ